MLRLRRRTIDLTIAIFVGLIPVFLLTVIFPWQVPESAEYDISSRVYPDTLAYLWIALSILHIGEVILRHDNDFVEISHSTLGYQAGILAAVAVGYVLLVNVGYLVGAAFYIFTFTWMMRERGPAAWALAVVTPVLVYLLMEAAFEVRLPSFLDWQFD